MTDKTSAGSSKTVFRTGKLFAEGWYSGEREWVDADAYRSLMRALECKQAKIDALMLEFCPGEMSAAQKAEWARHQRAAPETNAKPSLLNITRGQLDFTTAVTGNARLSGLTKAQFLHMVTLAWDARDAVKALEPRIIGAEQAGREAYLNAWDSFSEAERDEWTKRALGQ